jgi:hypothetical protein
MTPAYVNTFNWSVFKLQKEYPEAADEVERYMADSKFFRSLFVIMMVLGCVFLFQSGIGLTVKLACFALAAFSMVRYFNKRRKSTETALNILYCRRCLIRSRTSSVLNQINGLVSVTGARHYQSMEDRCNSGPDHYIFSL